MKYAAIHDGQTGLLFEVVPYHDKDTKDSLASKFAQKMWDLNRSDNGNGMGKDRFLDYEKMHFEMHSKGAYVLTERSKRAVYAILDHDGYDRTGVAMSAAKELAIHQLDWNNEN